MSSGANKLLFEQKLQCDAADREVFVRIYAPMPNADGTWGQHYTLQGIEPVVSRTIVADDPFECFRLITMLLRDALETQPHSFFLNGQPLIAALPRHVPIGWGLDVSIEIEEYIKKRIEDIEQEDTKKREGK